MKFLLQCGILFAICIIGNALSKWVALPIPGNIIGMGILFFLLYTGILKKHHIENVARFLLDNMAFFFIPSGVAILVYYEQLSQIIVPFLLIILFTTIIVMVVTGSCAQFLQTMREKFSAKFDGKLNRQFNEEICWKANSSKEFNASAMHERSRD